MRAAVLNAYNEPLVIEDLSAPNLGPNEVRVRIEASGVCHSDLTVQKGGVPMPPPLILGHEGSGTVLEVGDAVTRVKKGDRIIASFTAMCGGWSSAYATARATSAGWRGSNASNQVWAKGLARARGVSTNPGSTRVTRIPKRNASLRSAWPSPTMAHLLAM